MNELEGQGIEGLDNSGSNLAPEDAQPLVTQNLISVKLPDGTVVNNVPENITKSELMARVGKTAQPEAAPVNEQIVPQGAETLPAPTINPLVRSAGRAGRNMVGAVAGAADLVATPVKALEALGNAGLEASGIKDTGVNRFLQNGANANYRGSALAALDDATGNELKPRNTLENVSDFIGEAAVPVGALGKIGGAGEAAMTAVRGSEKAPSLATTAMQKYNIPLRVDQVTKGNVATNADKIGNSLPFSGSKSFVQKQMSAFNRALTKTFGEDSDTITPELMDKAFTNVGQKFDDLTKGKTFKIGENFDNGINAILEDSKITATDAARSNFNEAVKLIKNNVDPEGNIPGEVLGQLRSKINTLARKNSDPAAGELLRDLEGKIVDVIADGSPEARKAVGVAKQQYKNLITIEPLAQKAVDGNISPSLLSTRVAKVYGRQYTKGQAGDIGDLARIGKELMKQNAGSDTITKGLYAAGGASIIDPTVAATTVGGLALNRGVQGVNRSQALAKLAAQGFPEGLSNNLSNIGKGAGITALERLNSN